MRKARRIPLTVTAILAVALAGAVAAAHLGPTPADVVFLGFPDGSTNSLWNQNWDMRICTSGSTERGASPTCARITTVSRSEASSSSRTSLGS